MKLYHYCSIATLFLIFKNEKIWFSDLKNSNDYLEDKYIFDLFINYLKNSFCKDDFASTVLKLNEDEMIRAKEQTSIYGLCLTENCDTLLQWMTYGKSNSVCLEFDSDELNKHFKGIKIFDNEPQICVKKVNYFNNNDNELNKHFSQILKNNDNFICNCYTDLISLSLNSKNICWKDEKEYRIVFRNFIDKGFNSELPPVSFNGEKCSFDFLVKDGIPVFHYEIPFDIKLIKRIILGPNFSLSINELKNNLSLMNEKFDIDKIDFQKTNVTYRC